MFVRSRLVAAVTAALALTSFASAPALAKSHGPVKSHAKTTKKKVLASRAKINVGTGPAKQVTVTTTAKIAAYPTGMKGSGTEATCALWTERLQDDQQIIDQAPEADEVDASGPLNTDVDNALDAGCFVIF
jgi:hypothetical protein